jgi:Tol biopolymer transport system component
MRYLEALTNAALGLLLASAPAWSQAKPAMRPIATLPGVSVGDFAVMPNGRVMYYVIEDSLLAYDLATKRASVVARGEFDDFSVSPRGNRVVFDRENEDGSATHIWTIPVDTATGMARGPAQRVSTREGHEPRISPDGRMVAFVSPVDSSPNLVVVTATGGPERVVAHFELNLSYVDWTPDGKWLLVHLPATARAGSVVQRVPVTGGKPETLFSVPAAEGTRAAFDGEFTLFRAGGASQAMMRTGYRGPNGEQGEFDNPPNSWSRIDPVAGRTRRYVVVTSQSTQVYTANVSDGVSKPAAPAGDQARSPAFSPDGKQLAVVTSPASPSEVTIVQTDGSGRRLFEAPGQVGPFAFFAWSPDSRRLAFWAGNRQAMAMLDVSSGAIRILHRGPVGAMTWTKSGDAIRYVQFEPTSRKVGVYELPLAGTPKHILDVPPDMTHRGFFVSPSFIEYASTSAEVILPVNGGAPRRLPVDTPALLGVPSDHGDWVVFLLSANAGRPARVQTVNAQGDTSRIIDLPFEAFRTPFPTIAFAPDHRNIVMVGRTIGEKAYKLFSVPIDGTAPRVLATLSTELPVTNMVLARDGRTAAYTVTSPPTTTMYELDLRPLVQTAARPK